MERALIHRTLRIFRGEPHVAIASSVFCYGAGALALLLARIQFLRPSHDHMLNWLMVIMPLCGFLWLATQLAPAVRLGTGLASGVFALVAIIVGIRRRSHAPLLACMASLGCVAYQLRDLTPLPLKLKLIVWGSAALLAAVGLDRYLRTPRRGITSHQVGEGAAALDLVQWFGAGALTPKAAPQAESFKGGGGAFAASWSFRWGLVARDVGLCLSGYFVLVYQLRVGIRPSSHERLFSAG